MLCFMARASIEGVRDKGKKKKRREERAAAKARPDVSFVLR